MRATRTIAALAAVLACAAGCANQAPAAQPRPAEDTSTVHGGHPSPTTAPTSTSYPQPAWADQVPADTTQVVRTVSSDRWCTRPWCTITQAWVRGEDGWRLVREFRSSIASGGWGKEKQDDFGTPVGVYRIKVTFSTSETNPGRMPWRRRLPTSNVTDEDGALYNTWIEEPGRTDGNRPSMRWGFVVDYNNVRLQPGLGPAPVPDAGSGIFYHTSRPGARWAPTEGCTQVGDPDDMHWLLTWLRPGADPRVVQDT